MKRLKDRRAKKSKLLSLLSRLSVGRFKKRNILIGLGAIVSLLIITSYVFGYSSILINLRPPIELGKKETELFCEYKGSRLTATTTTYSNINNYYKNIRFKSNYRENSQYDKFTYFNPADNTIKQLADDIRSLGKKRGLSDDQLVELASCFVQNIPYDTPKGEAVLGSANIPEKELSQFPYETLFKNSGICTDKTYLGSALLRELGYGTGILLFPDAQHMALGVKAPNGYTDFGTKYTYIESTTPEFVIGEVPTDVSDANGTPAVAINSVTKLTVEQNPTFSNSFSKQTISNPNMVIDVNDGKQYSRIVEIVNLEKIIIRDYESLVSLEDQLMSAYNELLSRKDYMNSRYSVYVSTPDTKLDCGYKYDYSYTYTYGYYSSPYVYRCDTVSNYQKTTASISYNNARNSYNSQVNIYNGLIEKYNALADNLDNEIARYKTYDYN